jgi:predicted PurR-regulated permease PerM
MRNLEEKSFLILLAAISITFAWLLWPFSGTILWGTVLAIIFAPLHRRLLRWMPRHRNSAALATLAIVVLMVVLPLILVGGLVTRETVALYGRIESGELDLGRLIRRAPDVLPNWAAGLLDRFGLTDLQSVQARFAAALSRAAQFIAGQALAIGQNTLDLVVSFFITIYLLFFLLRDGDIVFGRVRDAIPLHPEQRRALFLRFATVIRATVKGNILVAAVQGALGGIMFWFLGIQAALLWAVVMALLSLLPAVGAALVWVPVTLYLLATGAVWQGVVLLVYGVMVISLADNLLRPLLVGKETRMPDWLVLLSTLGGITLLGINGLVIGPVVAAMFIAAWDLFTASRLDHLNSISEP